MSAIIIGFVLFVAGALMAGGKIKDISPDTEAILASMFFLSGCICLAIGLP